MALMVRNTDEANDFYKQFIGKGTNPDFKIFEVDMENPHQITKVFEEVMEFFGEPLDHVIICHGLVVQKDCYSCDMFDFDKTMTVNVRSVLQITSLSVPFLKATSRENSPSITILTSHQGCSPDPMAPLMSVSASMIQMMIKSVALETAAFGIRVNGVAVGVTKTAVRTKDIYGVTEPMTGLQNSKFLYDAE